MISKKENAFISILTMRATYSYCYHEGNLFLLLPWGQPIQGFAQQPHSDPNMLALADCFQRWNIPETCIFNHCYHFQPFLSPAQLYISDKVMSSAKQVLRLLAYLLINVTQISISRKSSIILEQWVLGRVSVCCAAFDHYTCVGKNSLFNVIYACSPSTLMANNRYINSLTNQDIDFYIEFVKFMSSKVSLLDILIAV